MAKSLTDVDINNTTIDMVTPPMVSGADVIFWLVPQAGQKIPVCRPAVNTSRFPGGAKFIAPSSYNNTVYHTYNSVNYYVINLPYTITYSA